MVGIQVSDVATALQNCVPYLIFAGIVAVIAVIAMVAVMKLKKSTKYLVRTQAAIAIVAAVAIAANLILTGPMNTLVSLATGDGKITQESSAKAEALAETIAEEGIILLENENALPLQSGKKLNVFGWASTNPAYGGTGSGSLSDSAPVVSLLDGLHNAGFETNTELSDFYTAYCDQRPELGIMTRDFTLPEPPAADYSDSLINNAKAYSDTALIVLTRTGGEDFDIATDMSQVMYTNNSESYVDFEAGEHILQLSQTEADMIDLVCANFNDVIVIYNGMNAFELGFVEEYPQIKGLLWVSGVGQNGFNALGKILAGKVNPSAKTVDTMVYDLDATPTANNFGEFLYNNVDDVSWSYFGMVDVTYTPSFVNYVEGIYVGYRFYETAATEGLIDYDAVVQYPFGYGLSYTSFQQEMGSVSESNGVISFDVTVTNTGNTAGKDVVEVYYDPPYTNGGIEKASANLVAFDKTDLLNPGDSQTLTITFNLEDMASYDSSNGGAYVLEDGEYLISIRTDSHNIVAEEAFTVSSTIRYDNANPRSTDMVAASNQFEDAIGEITYLSRKDGFANYAEATAAPSNFALSDHYAALREENTVFDPERDNDPNDVMPTTGAKNGLTLSDLRGADYDDPRWDTLLDQMTADEMNTLFALAGYQTQKIDSVGKVATYDYDGPASINNMFTGQSSIGFPCATMLAMTWNEDLAYAFGDSIGEMADEMDVSGWYAPAMNTHRSAFGGRNFEYYSEDGLLGGKIAANSLKGAATHGVYGYIKHFAVNDQETNRGNTLLTWATEQSIREIYLRPFEIAVKEGNASAAMISHNFIGDRWTGFHSGLLKNVLKGEWGFQGMAISDYFGGYGYQEGDKAIRAGLDGCLQTMSNGFNFLDDTQSATAVIALRGAAKNILYTVANSRAMAPENVNHGLLPWQIALIAVDILLLAAVVAFEIVVVKKGYEKRKEQAQ